MKKKSLFVITALLASVFFSGTAMAAFFINITTDYSEGDSQITFDLNINVEDASIEWSNYEFVFSYDSTELTYDSYTHNLPTGFIEFMAPSDADGTLYSFVGYAFGGSNATIDVGTFTLGSFTFDVTDAVADGVTDFNFLYSDIMFGFTVDGVEYNTAELRATVCVDHYTDVASVPLPGGIWLLGSGIAGLACARRKKA